MRREPEFRCGSIRTTLDVFVSNDEASRHPEPGSGGEVEQPRDAGSHLGGAGHDL